MKPLFTFDDGNTSDISAAAILKENGLVGVFFINDGPSAEVLTRSLLALGMVVGNHTAHHYDMRHLSKEQVEDEVIPFNKKLKEWGASGEWFSYPFSQRPPQSAQSILLNEFKYIFKGYDEPSAEQHPSEVNRVSIVGKTDEQLKEYLKRGIPLQLHDLDGPHFYSIKTELFTRLCQYLKSLQTI